MSEKAEVLSPRGLVPLGVCEGRNEEKKRVSEEGGEGGGESETGLGLEEMNLPCKKAQRTLLPVCERVEMREERVSVEVREAREGRKAVELDANEAIPSSSRIVSFRLVHPFLLLQS